MDFVSAFKDKIFSEKDFCFDELALELFLFQADNCDIYRSYLNILGINPKKVNQLTQIPFLPIEFFRDAKVVVDGLNTEYLFESSGTTHSIPSRHYIADLEIYRKSLLHGFRLFYGDPANFTFFGLLPSLKERNTSSLAYMVNELINASGQVAGGFYHQNYDKLISDLNSQNQKSDRKVFLFGISHALLSLSEISMCDLSSAIVMETGGMKGHGQELVREDLHNILCQAMNLSVIHSEYGMTEMLSQSYSNGNGIFKPVPWLKIMIRDLNDPFRYVADQMQGGINVIDLANICSCAFLETRDIGKLIRENAFEVSGRAGGSDMRGCNLLL